MISGLPFISAVAMEDMEGNVSMMQRNRFELYFLFLIHCEYINARAIAL